MFNLKIQIIKNVTINNQRLMEIMLCKENFIVAGISKINADFL